MQIFLVENKKLNLSAYRTEEQCWVGNVLDSIAVRESLEVMWKRLAGSEERGARVIDVGMGGGFPLLPLAILLPDISFTGLDATGKKVEAVRRVVDELKVASYKLKVQFLVGRAEEFGHDPAHREQYDAVLARAVAPLSTLLEYMSPFARKGGYLYCWKSMETQEEEVASLEAREILKARLIDRIQYTLPGDWGKRQILVFEKTGELSSDYPRAMGVPKKEPL